jgi:hypothetical protein
MNNWLLIGGIHVLQTYLVVLMFIYDKYCMIVNMVSIAMTEEKLHYFVGVSFSGFHSHFNSFFPWSSKSW